MILTKENILAEVGFEPALDAFQVNPHSVDLRLAEEVVLPPFVKVTDDVKVDINYGRALAKSMEEVRMPADVMGVVYPRSSTNRRGITLDMTGVVDANYRGRLTLPLVNHTSKEVRLMRGERVASIVFHRLEKKAETRLSKYHGTDGSYVPDKSEETALLEFGDIGTLKFKYRL